MAIINGWPTGGITVTEQTKPAKPLGHKAYGSIPHLPNSRLGPGDHSVNAGQARMCLECLKRPQDQVIIQEKLDGSCCAVARVDGQIIALGRSGYLAQTSRFEQHQLFAAWVRHNESKFEFLVERERVVGEWLAQAHGTIYQLKHEPFVAFDVMRGHERLTYDVFRELIGERMPTPRLIHRGSPLPIDAVSEDLHISGHGAVGECEGAVWRYESGERILFLAKWVRPDKEDGIYLPEISGSEAVWNWRPDWRD